LLPGQHDPIKRGELIELIQELKRIRSSMLELEASVDLARFGNRRASARNLLHYVALRRQDLRSIQEKLAEMGVSSLGRSESHVLYNLNAVLLLLHDLAREPLLDQDSDDLVSPSQGLSILENQTIALFGQTESGRAVRMMVTMPSEAATDYSLVRDLVAAGMDCMRINCAHDSEPAWSAMIENLRRAESEVGRRCRVLMDIAGPKLRTGRLEPGPQVLRLRPQKDAFGRVTSPARVILTARTASGRSAGETAPTLQVRARWLEKVVDGIQISLTDARGSKRALVVTQRRVGSVRAETSKTTYLTPETRLVVRVHGRSYSTSVLNIPYRENPIELKKGDTLIITASAEPGRPSVQDRPAVISCTLPEALTMVKAGERIWLDDGKIGGTVKSASADELRLEVIHAAPSGTKLREDKGINLPDTNIKLPPLTPKDLEDLRFIVKNADIVGYSFVRTPADLQHLRNELASLERKDMGIILKIETRRAFEQLPGLLLESMLSPVSGLMIARGDLAVECGYERLAEVQEEILWMSEAAHMPTIWATQVLEGLTKNGIPSRAEVSDAAMGEMSECVMLNKGPHVVEALRALDSILRRMQSHQRKKLSMMRQLNIASSFFRTIKG
jgi:pyruvate kinase